MTPVFANLSQTLRALLEIIMSAPIEAIDAEVEESLLEMEMEAEEVASKVAKVLAEVPKSPRMSRPKPTPTKEIVRDKTGK